MMFLQILRFKVNLLFEKLNNLITLNINQISGVDG